jgi:hypothetical protein
MTMVGWCDIDCMDQLKLRLMHLPAALDPFAVNINDHRLLSSNYFHSLPSQPLSHRSIVR